MIQPLTLSPKTALEDDALFYEDVGKALRRRRKELGLSLKSVGDALGISPPMVLKYEAGAKLSAATLIQLAIALDCLPSEFLNTPDPHEQPTLRRLVSAWSRLPNDGARAATIELMETLAGRPASLVEALANKEQSVAPCDPGRRAPATKPRQGAVPKDLKG